MNQHRKPFSNKVSASTQVAFEFANAVTLQYDQQPTVTNLGTATAPVLEFGIPQGAPGDVLTGNAYVQNLVVEGLVLSAKANIATGFAGGPRVSQGGWDAPANAHSIAWSQLADGNDNVTGFLYVHVSSKDASRKNGIATATLIKDLGQPLDVMVTALHQSANLHTFEVGVSDDTIRVATDPTCSVCWSFIAAT